MNVNSVARSIAVAILVVAAVATIGGLGYAWHDDASKLDRADATLIATQGQLDQTKESLASTKEQLASDNDALNSLQNDLSKMKIELVNTQNQLASANEKLATTQTQLASLQEQYTSITSGPNPAVLTKTYKTTQGSSGGFLGIGSTPVCDITLIGTVANQGSAGNVTVVARLDWTTWQSKSESSYFRLNETKQVSFSFSGESGKCAPPQFTITANPS